MNEPTDSSRTEWRSLALLLMGNVLFGAGLFVHAFLFNFYLRDLQLPASVMGHQVAAMTLGGLCALLPAGIVIDRLGTRTALMAGVAITFVGLTATALARAAVLIYGSAALIGLGAATCRVAWGPAIMRLTSEAMRARAFTWNVALLIAASAAWTYLSGILPDWSARVLPASGFSGIQLVLLGGAVVTAAAAACYGTLRLPPVKRQVREPLAWTLSPGLRGLVSLIAFWMLAAALVLPFFNIYFTDRFAMPVARVGATFALAQIATALALIGAAELARRRGARFMLVLWTAAMAPALLGLALTNVLWVAVAFYLIQGFVAPATNPLIDQLLLESAPSDRHGVVSGWRNAAAEVAGASGASAGGYLIASGSFDALFLVATAVAAAAAGMLSVALRRRRPSRLLSDAEAA